MPRPSIIVLLMAAVLAGCSSLEVPVDEGPLYRVRSLSLEAVDRDWDERLGWTGERSADLLFPEEDLLPLLELQPGMPLEDARILHDKLALGRYYGARGFVPQDYFREEEAGGWDWLEPIYLFDTERNEVDVVYRFVQGRQRSVREVQLYWRVSCRFSVRASAMPMATLAMLPRSDCCARVTPNIARTNVSVTACLITVTSVRSGCGSNSGRSGRSHYVRPADKRSSSGGSHSIPGFVRMRLMGCVACEIAI